MAYLRFLTDRDYNSIATEEHMKQLIRDIPERIPQAEQRAEMQMLEYLDQYYEIEKVLAVGKNIRTYNPAVSYPAKVWIKIDEEIFKTLTSINGIKKPTIITYWRHMTDVLDPLLIDHAKKYSQLRTYGKGEVVRFGTEYWQCVTPHGYESGNIHIPGVNAWKEIETVEWEPNMDWEKDQVCSFNGQFYQYLGKTESDEEEEIIVPDTEETPDETDISNEDSDEDVSEGSDSDYSDEENENLAEDSDDAILTPEEDECWGLIGDYSEDLEYDYSEDVKDYVVFEDKVFYPIINPNADKLEEGVNIIRDDPRNANIVAHMSRIALYHLHSIISPTNISETRRWAYEDSMTWLYNASKFKINPQLPRKKEKDSCQPKVDWACATFQRDYDPYENAWLI